jgi:hypothetical protein
MPAVLGDLETDDEEFGEAHDINVTPFIDVMLVLLRLVDHPGTFGGADQVGYSCRRR